MVETHLKKVADGDTAAVHEVLNRYGGLVWSLARRLSQNEADAEDAVQEVFIDVWRNAARFDPALASEATFITLLARRRLIDRHRKRTRRVVTTPLDETISQSSAVAAETTDFETQSEVSEEALRAKEQMQRLRPEEQRVLELSVYQGLSQSEIASQMSLPLGTVKTHARRGLIRLRELLAGKSKDRVKGGTR